MPKINIHIDHVFYLSMISGSRVSEVTSLLLKKTICFQDTPFPQDCLHTKSMALSRNCTYPIPISRLLHKKSITGLRFGKIQLIISLLVVLFVYMLHAVPSNQDSYWSCLLDISDIVGSQVKWGEVDKHSSRNQQGSKGGKPLPISSRFSGIAQPLFFEIALKLDREKRNARLSWFQNQSK